MATDQETAQRILGINNALQAGEIDQQTANELAAEDQVVLPVAEQPSPQSLQPSIAPESLQPVVAEPPAYQQFQPTPEMVAGLRAVQNQPNPLDMNKFVQEEYNIPTQEIVDTQPVINAAAPAVPVAPAPVVPQPTLQPTVQQQAKAVEEIVKPAQEAVAEHRATQMAQTELQAAMIKEQERLAAREKEIQDEISRQDTSVRFQSLPEIMQGGSFENKLGAAIALFAGAVSQGLTGAKSNPVMDFIDRQVALQADKDKLTADGKLALKKQLIDIGNMKLENLKARSQDQYQQQMIQAKQDELLNERQKIEGDQRLKAQELFGKGEAKSALAAAYRGEAIDPQLAQNMNETEQKSLVQVRGKTYKAINPSAAQKFQESQASITAAMNKLEPYKALVEKGLLRTLGEKGVMAALKDRAAGETMRTAIVGALRLPYTGPGALSDTERKALDKAIGEFGVFNLPPVQAAKMNFIIHDLRAELQRVADNSNIKAQVWPETFIKTNDGKMLSKQVYFEKKAQETGKPVEEIERLYNLTQGK
jgi:hypothetical protein